MFALRYIHTASELHVSYRAIQNSVVAKFACILIVLGGCDNGDQTTVERVSVSGKVTLDGQPLEAGAIVFLGDGKGPDGVPVTAFSFVENGSYHIDAKNGPTVGPARVKFRPKPLQREVLEELLDQAAKTRTRRPLKTTVVEIPSKYVEGLGIQIELARGENHHDFQLDSRR